MNLIIAVFLLFAALLSLQAHVLAAPLPHRAVRERALASTAAREHGVPQEVQQKHLTDHQASRCAHKGTNTSSNAGTSLRLPLGSSSSKAHWLSREGIPPATNCTATDWCDRDGVCSTVCKRGSVEVDLWLQNAINTQLTLARRLPLCYASLLGSHNSGITLADGYGNLDEQFSEYLRWIKSKLRTNNQWLSLTDQLRLGVRALELDTHYVQGELRIAHCGGVHVGLDSLIKALNFVARLLGHPFRWDTETVGCDPSLSSIPVRDQRSFAGALAEVAAWLAEPQRSREVLLVYLDDQPDLLDWGLVPRLLAELEAAFPAATIYTPADHAARGTLDWPSMDELAEAGKRVIVASAADYGEAMARLIFPRGAVCGWTEPPFAAFEGSPRCVADPDAVPPEAGRTLAGRWFRVPTCELRYGPFNCNFVWKADNWPVLDEELLPDAVACGLAQPAPDRLTPRRAAAAIWSWAPGHPYAADVNQCAAISAADGRWRATNCSAVLPTACRTRGGGDWLPTRLGSPGGCEALAPGAAFELPRHAKENLALAETLRAARPPIDAAWLPLTGPGWEVPQRAEAARTA